MAWGKVFLVHFITRITNNQVLKPQSCCFLQLQLWALLWLLYPSAARASNNWITFEPFGVERKAWYQKKASVILVMIELTRISVNIYLTVKKLKKGQIGCFRFNLNLDARAPNFWTVWSWGKSLVSEESSCYSGSDRVNIWIVSRHFWDFGHLSPIW